VLLLAALGWWLAGRNAGPAAASAEGVAVLPFADLSGDDEYFADGVADELTSALSQVPGLQVASRTSAFAWKGRGADIREIGRALGVGAVVEGTIRRSGNRLRLSARLTSTSDGFMLWSETFERNATDLFVVQDELARSITRALRPRLTALGAAVQMDRGTDNLQAYDLYLQGRYHWHQRGEGPLLRATGLFEQAIARDSGFARAWAGLGDALTLLPLYGGAPPASSISAESAARRALALDSTLPEAHATLGELHMAAGRWGAAESSLRRAIALDSTYAPASQWLGEVLLSTGRFPGAVTALSRAAELDPLSPTIGIEVAYAHALNGDDPAAIQKAGSVIAAHPDVWPVRIFAAAAWLALDQPDSALSQMHAVLRLAPEPPPVWLGLLGYVQGRAGHPDSAAITLARLRKATPPPPLGLALAWLGPGQEDSAFAWLNRAIDAHDPILYASSVTAPWFDGVREDPRLDAAARRLGIE
jgi:serine/threonine-protein kinase